MDLSMLVFILGVAIMMGLFILWLCYYPAIFRQVVNAENSNLSNISFTLKYGSVSNHLNVLKYLLNGKWTASEDQGHRSLSKRAISILIVFALFFVGLNIMTIIYIFP